MFANNVSLKSIIQVKKNIHLSFFATPVIKFTLHWENDFLHGL